MDKTFFMGRPPRFSNTQVYGNHTEARVQNRLVPVQKAIVIRGYIWLAVKEPDTDAYFIVLIIMACVLLPCWIGVACRKAYKCAKQTRGKKGIWNYMQRCR